MTFAVRLAALGRLWRDPPVLLVLAFNLLPVLCVVVFDWSAAALLLLYWVENLVIGVFNILKMLAIGIAGGLARLTGAVFATAFFTLHYSLFCLGHGFFVLLFLAADGWATTQAGPREAARIALAEPGFGWSVAAIVAVHAVLFVVEWLGKGAWRTATIQGQMGEPYGRIMALHIALLASAFLIASLGDPVWAVAALGLAKTLFEGAMQARPTKVAVPA